MTPLQVLLLSCTLLCAQLGAAQFRTWGYRYTDGGKGVYIIPVRALGGVSGDLAGATHVLLGMANFDKPGVYSIGVDGEVDWSQLTATNASRSILVHAPTFTSPAAVTSDEPLFIDTDLLPFLATGSGALTAVYVDITQHSRSETCSYIFDNDLVRPEPKIIQSLRLGFLITLSLSPISSPGTSNTQFHLSISFTSPTFVKDEESWTHVYPIMPTPANETFTFEAWNQYSDGDEPSHWAPNTTIGDLCTNKMYSRYDDSHRGRWIWISVLVVAQLLTLAFVAYKIMGWRKKRSGARSAGTRETGLWEELGGSAVVEWWKRRGGQVRGTREEESELWDELEERK